MSNIKLIPFTENKKLKSDFHNFLLDFFGFDYDKKSFYLGNICKSAKITGIDELGKNSCIIFDNWNYNKKYIPCSIFFSLKDQTNLKENFVGKIYLRDKEYYLYTFNPFKADSFHVKII